MNEMGETNELSKRIYDLVRAYVMRKSEAKSGIKWDDFKSNRIKDPQTDKERINVPEKYREAREKVCAEAFLRLRSCKSREDFLSYFTGSICSVPQYLPPEEYSKLALWLMSGESWSDAKALAMLAFSGLSRI
jgi:CRISPR-associated protein Cmx8